MRIGIPKRSHKYAAKAVTVDGHKFPSTAEARRYAHLKLLERAGQVVDIELQPRFPLVVQQKLICTYVADFRYIDVVRACTVVEDVKGVKTPLYTMKKKLVEALYPGIVIEEIKV